VATPSGDSDRQDVHDRFVEYRTTGRRATRRWLVEAHMEFAARIARRFRAGRSGHDDLEQVAMVGLVKSVDRFDPERGVPFTAFAGVTIEGELKRYLRDSTWAVKVPRGTKTLHLSVRGAENELSARLGRSPTTDEVAAHLDVDRDDVVAGLAAASLRRAAPLMAADDDQSGSLTTDEGGFDAVENRTLLLSLLTQLAPRERDIVRMRFVDELSQSEIAQRVGISQMQVSRLLRQAIEALRSGYFGEPEPEPGGSAV